jgi:hypothetical protein
MKTKIFSILMILVMTVMIIPAVAFAAAPDGGPSSDGILILDNKDSAWQRIADGKYGVFTYNSSGNTLNWSLAVTGLGSTPTAYSLIYFADPYPGNPCALIWSGTSTSVGRIDVPLTNTELNMDLPTDPDSNMLVSHAGPPDNYITPFGAKIWLIPSAYYDAALKKVTVWNSTVISSILFETNLVLYTDTNKVPPAGTPLVTTVTMPASILSLGVSPVEGLNFGSVAIGTCSTPGQIITITNTGTVPIIVTATPSAGFYAVSLKLGGALVPTGGWKTATIPVGTVPVTFSATVCPLPGLTGTQTGTLTFMAEFAP